MMMKPSHSGVRHRSRRRTDFEIIVKILENANGEILPSKLLLKANLNTARMARYTDLLVKNGLLTKKTIAYGNGKREVFMTTQEGIEYISTHKNMKQIFDGIGVVHKEARPLSKTLN